MRGDHRRCQAEKPLIVLFRFPEPALYVYAAGNQRDPNDAYRLFRGRKPEFTALLRKKGLASSA
jgi:hypothetical protein